MVAKDSFWVSPLVWMFVGLLIGTAIGYTFYQTDIATYLPHSVGTSSESTATVPTNSVVNIDVVPDWGGSGYDAFIIPSNANGTIPKPATNSSAPGPNDNNITMPVNASVTFVITNLDTAVNLNFTGNVTLPFTIYNETASGQIPVRYSSGEAVGLPVSHTFVVAATDLNIPIPPDTIVTFNVIFTKPGAYLYFCSAPCGPGMARVGYMEGYINVG